MNEQAEDVRVATSRSTLVYSPPHCISYCSLELHLLQHTHYIELEEESTNEVISHIEEMSVIIHSEV